MIILPNNDKNSAKTFADRMRETIASHAFQDIPSAITVSIGIGGMPDANIRNVDELIRCADIALYRAKQSGRNRVEVGSGEDLLSNA